MTSCPDLSTLEQNPNARQDHLSSCTTCRTLFALRDGGEEEFGAECEAAETLIAVATDMALNAIDQRRLTNHLETCGRCSSLACGLLLHGDADAEASVATADAEIAVQRSASPSGAGAATPTSLPQPANDQRTVIFVALGLLTAAAALVLIFKGLGSPEKSTTRDLATRVAPEEGIAETPTATTPAPETPIAKTPTAKTPTVSAPTAETPTAETPTAETPTAEKPTAPNDMVGSESEDESAVGVSRPVLPVQGAPVQPPTQAVNPAQAKRISSQLNRARNSVRALEYRKGLRLVEEVLKLQPGNQDAIIVAAIATCNLRRVEEAKRYVSQISNPTRKRGLTQICSRLGIRLDGSDAAEPEEDDEDAAALTREQRVTLLTLVEKSEAAVRNQKYGEGSRECRKALALSPSNQRASVVCAIAACNVGNGIAAKEYIRKVKSTSRRNGLTQICLRLGVDPGEEAE